MLLNPENAMFQNKLPSSQQEIASLIMVSLLAGLAAIARVLYGREELRWRYTAGALIMAMATSIVVYGFLVNYMGQIGGHASTAIGAATGLFTDDFLRRIHEIVQSKGIPGIGPKDKGEKK